MVREIPLDRRPVGMTIVDGCIYLVSTDDDWEDRALTRVDARGATPVAAAIAPLAFDARGLAYDGSRFWTTHREANEIVAFSLK